MLIIIKWKRDQVAVDSESYVVKKTNTVITALMIN